MIFFYTILEHVVYLYLRLETPSIIFCSNPAKPQAVPFITLTAGVSDLCVSLTRKSCQHAAYPSVKKKERNHPPLLFLIIALLFAPSHLALWHQEPGALWRGKQRLPVRCLLCPMKKKERRGSDSTAKTAACLLYTPSPLRRRRRHLPVSFSLPPLSASIPTRTETSKRTVPWCASNKSSLLNFIHLCLNNARATNQKMLDTASEVMRYISLRLLHKSPCVRGGDGWLLLWLMAVAAEEAVRCPFSWD